MKQTWTNTPKTTIVAGVEFPSFKAAARRFRLHPRTVRSRLDDGWTIEQAFGVDQPPYKPKGTPIKEVTLFGRTFSSKRHAAEYYNVSPATLYGRIKLGWTENQILGIDLRPQLAKAIENNRLKTVRKEIEKASRPPRPKAFRETLCTIAGVEDTVEWHIRTRKHHKTQATISCVYQRVRQGMSIAQAIVTPVVMDERPSVEFCCYMIRNKLTGQTYIGSSTSFKTRIEDHFRTSKTGRMYDDMRKLGRKSFQVTILETYNTRDEMLRGEKLLIAKHKTFDRDTFHYNKSRGGEWTISTGTNCKRLTYKGVEYPSFRALKRSLGLLHMEKLIDKRISKGWTIERALTTPVGKQSKKWTKEECIDRAKQYDSRKSFIQENGGMGTIIYKYGWSNECFGHMPKLSSGRKSKFHYATQDMTSTAAVCPSETA